MAKLISNSCPYCDFTMACTEMSCGRCQISVRAEFPDSPLSQLPAEHQRFIEMFVLASGSLKEIASHAGVSYPTVRNRLNRVIDALRAGMAEGAPSGVSPASEDEPSPAEIIKRIS